MINKNINHRVFSACWFAGFALLIILPFAIFGEIENGIDNFEQHVFWIFCIYCLPVLMAAFFGARYGEEIILKDKKISWQLSFYIGLKIALTAAGGWIMLSFFSILLLIRMYVNCGRIFGAMMVLALFGCPLYGFLSGFAGVALHIFTIKTGISNNENGQKTAK